MVKISIIDTEKPLRGSHFFLERWCRGDDIKFSGFGLIRVGPPHENWSPLELCRTVSMCCTASALDSEYGLHRRRPRRSHRFFATKNWCSLRGHRCGVQIRSISQKPIFPFKKIDISVFTDFWYSEETERRKKPYPYYRLIDEWCAWSFKDW